MIKELTKKSDKQTDLTKSEIEDVVSSVIKHRKGSKKDRFYLLKLMGLPTNIAAKSVGYSESYAYRLMQNYRNNQNVRSHVEQIANLFPEQYKTVCKIRLAELADIEGAAIDEYRKDPKLLISKPQLARQLKQASGVIGDEYGPPHQQINIKEVQNLMLQLHQGKVEEVKNNVPDAEIVGQDDE
jgi:hypothetical protein